METSATYDQIEAAYYAMKQASKPHDDVFWYQGALTNLLAENGISKAKYSSITGWMKRMGCIERVRRGAGPVPSIWLLLKEPTREDFDNAKLQVNKPKVQNPYKNEGNRATPTPYDQRFSDLNERINEIERKLEDAGI